MQWLKGGAGYTEDAAIAALKRGYPHVIDHQRCGRDAIVWRGQQQEMDCIEAQRGWEIAQAAIASGLYKTIILDELNPTVDLDLLPVEPICQALLKKSRDTEVIITGESLPALLPEGSDVDITIKVDRSQLMKFTAYFPLLNHTEDLEIEIKR
jgi:cob(I)alamin adenosyltransferase